MVVSQIHADGAAENFIADLQSVLKSLSSSEIKNKIFKTTDALAVNALKKVGYNSIKNNLGEN